VFRPDTVLELEVNGSFYMHRALVGGTPARPVLAL
jgi:hypothetical protein